MEFALLTIEEEDVSQTSYRKRSAQAVRTPSWFWVAIGAVALIGVSLIAYSTLQQVNVVGVTAEGDYFMGNPDAPVTIIDWGSFGCGACAGHVRETMPLLQKRYIETGKVKYIYRPLLFDVEEKNEQLAAEALYCAGDEAKFWEMHDWMFLNVNRWGQYPDIIGALVDMAPAEVGLDGAALRSCLEQEKYRDHVLNLTEDASARGVTGTPTFLVNDRLLYGPDFTEFRKVLDGTQEVPTGLQLLLAIGLPAVFGMFILGGAGTRVGGRVLTLRMVIGLLALLGLLVSTYLSLYELQVSGNLVCPAGGGCGEVNRSTYVDMFGVPIGLIGMFGYALILVIVLTQLTRRRLFRAPVGALLVALSGVGFLFSLFLTYLEVFQIRALCTWCLVSALLMTGILGLSIAAVVIDEREK
jgi:protein-disulfide isomerase/uncharacterized membrane protein